MTAIRSWTRSLAEYAAPEVAAPPAPRSNTRSAAPFVLALVVLALAAAVQAVAYPELTADIFTRL